MFRWWAGHTSLSKGPLGQLYPTESVTPASLDDRGYNYEWSSWWWWKPEHWHCLDIGQHTVQCDGDFGYNLVQLLAVMDRWGWDGITGFLLLQVMRSRRTGCCARWTFGLTPNTCSYGPLVICAVETGLHACMCTSSWIAILQSSPLLCHFLVCHLVLCLFYKVQKKRKAVQM